MKKRVERRDGYEWTYRIYKNGDEAFLWKTKLPPPRPERGAPMTRDELVDADYPRVDPDAAFERAWLLWHPQVTAQ